MQFQFDAHQDYQLQAIAAVVDLFEGQPRVETDLTFALGASGLAAARIPDDKIDIQRDIDTTDAQIDALVYELYDLTEEEIAIVEGR